MSDCDLTIADEESRKQGYDIRSNAELIRLARHFLLRLQPDLDSGRRVLDAIEKRLK